MASQKGSSGSQGLFGGASPGVSRGGVFGNDAPAKPSPMDIWEFDNKVSELVMRKGNLMHRIRKVTGVLGALSADHADNMKGDSRGLRGEDGEN